MIHDISEMLQTAVCCNSRGIAVNKSTNANAMSYVTDVQTRIVRIFRFHSVHLVLCFICATFCGASVGSQL